MKKLIFGLLISVFFISSAQAGETFKVGVLNLQKVLQTSPKVQKIRKALRAEFKPRSDKVKAAAAKLKKEMDKLYRDSAVMSQKDRQKLQDQITRDRRQVQALQASLQQDAGIKQRRKMQSFLENVNKKLQDLAKKEKYDLILLKGSLPYASSRIDVTDKLIKLLNR